MGNENIYYFINKPLFERSSCTNLIHISENGLYFLPTPRDRAAGCLSLLHTAGTIREQLGTIGNSLGTNILRHRDKFATK
jgi:hypothetical protein